MKQRDLIIILGFEIVVIAIVTALFQLIPSKTIAAIGASLCFISLGVWINLLALKWSRFYLSATFWFAQFHLFFSAIPLFVYRMLYLNTGFQHIEIFGIPGPEFHRIATALYAALMVATLVDLVLVKFVYNRQ